MSLRSDESAPRPSRGAIGRQAARERWVEEQPELDPQSLSLQLLYREVSESMGNHDSEIVDAGSVD